MNTEKNLHFENHLKIRCLRKRGYPTLNHRDQIYLTGVHVSAIKQLTEANGEKAECCQDMGKKLKTESLYGHAETNYLKSVVLVS